MLSGRAELDALTAFTRENLQLHCAQREGGASRRPRRHEGRGPGDAFPRLARRATIRRHRIALGVDMKSALSVLAFVTGSVAHAQAPAPDPIITGGAAHGHIAGTGAQAATANLLTVSDGDAKDIAALQAKLPEWSTSATAATLGWISFGYDDAQVKEQRYPTRDDLEAVSKDVPILVVHKSSHLGAANRKAVELAGVTATTPTPPGQGSAAQGGWALSWRVPASG
jgi:hypothetical protein